VYKSVLRQTRSQTGFSLDSQLNDLIVSFHEESGQKLIIYTFVVINNVYSKSVYCKGL